jgi:hypothetical protein
MAGYVIDTNVPIVANGRSDGISLDCRQSAMKVLMKAVNGGKIFVDAAGEIQSEYRRHLNPQGQPGVGDLFYREVLNCHPDRVVQIEVSKLPGGEFSDVPQELVDAGFDPSDRKFVAVAKVAKSPVYNAVDTDWVEHRAILEANKVKVVFVCGPDPNSWREV